jgi:hypothetical protein
MVHKVAAEAVAGPIYDPAIAEAIESSRALLQLLIDRGVLMDFDGVLKKLDGAKMLLSKGNA